MSRAGALIDWQFWLATAVAAFAAWWLVRYLWRIVRPAKSKRTRVTLTIGGRRPGDA